MVVVGVWEPVSAIDPFWNGATFLGAPLGQLSVVYPVLTSAQSFYAALSAFPGLKVTQYWVSYTLTSRLTPTALAAVGGAITRYRSLLDTTTATLPGVTDVGVITQLDHLASGLLRQLNLLTLPIDVLLALLASFGCLFIAVTAGALAEANARAMVILRSRGASGAQLLGVVGVQGIALAVVALLLGPPLGLLGVWALLQVSLSGATHAAYGPSLGVFARSIAPGSLATWAGLGALVGVCSVVIGALASVGQSTTAYARSQGRQTRILWRHVPLDLTIILLALAGYVEFLEFGAASTQAEIGTTSLLVVSAPALVLLSGALIAARLAPVVASWALAIGLRRRGITLMLAMAPLVRGTTRFAQMAFLTTLALGLACFSLIFRASLASAQLSASAYSVGSDARIVQRNAEAQNFDARLLAIYRRVPGVQAATPVYRTQETTPALEGGLAVDALAIDPTRFGAVAQGLAWRDDFAAQPLDTLLADLAQPAPVMAGAAAPWAIVSASYAAHFDARVGDHVTLLLSETSASAMTFTVAAIAQAFPTIAPGAAPGGFVVISLPSFASAVAAQQGSTISPVGANEFWLRMTAPGAANRALQNLMASQPQLDIDHIALLSDTLAATQVSPAGAGLRALLLLSAGVALLLASLGALIQTLAVARRERVRFAILRTLGLSQLELTLLPLEELLLTQALGIGVGSAVGAALLFAVTPLLRVIAAASQVAGPPPLLVIPTGAIAGLYGAFAMGTLAVVALTAWRLWRAQVSGELRISED